MAQGVRPQWQQQLFSGCITATSAFLTLPDLAVMLAAQRANSVASVSAVVHANKDQARDKQHRWEGAGDTMATTKYVVLTQVRGVHCAVQVCSHIHAEAAQNEMDALALAEVLVPCIAWKPPAKPQGTGAPGPWQGLAKALTLNKNTGAAAGSADTAAAAAGGTTEGDAAATAAQGVADEQQQQRMDEANRVLPLNDAELEAVVTVVEFMVTNYSSVFASTSDSTGSAVGVSL